MLKKWDVNPMTLSYFSFSQRGEEKKKRKEKVRWKVIILLFLRYSGFFFPKYVLTWSLTMENVNLFLSKPEKKKDGETQKNKEKKEKSKDKDKDKLKKKENIEA